MNENATTGETQGLGPALRRLGQQAAGLFRTSMKKDVSPLTLEWINLEFCSSCNLRCKWCSLDHDKPSQFMSPELLSKVLDDIIEDPGIDLDRIELHNAGETLMHTDLPVMLAEIAARKDSLPTINLLTNASALTQKKSRELLNSGALDIIRFSIDGGTKQSFEELRAPARWERIRDNLHTFLDENERSARPIKTGVIACVERGKPLDDSWMEEDFQKLFARIDDVGVRYPHNWDGSVELDVDDQDYQASAAAHVGQVCKFLLKDLVVLPNGDVTVCCADLNSRGTIGNVFASSVRDVFHSAKRQTMLRLFESGQKSQIELCKNCTGYYD